MDEPVDWHVHVTYPVEHMPDEDQIEHLAVKIGGPITYNSDRGRLTISTTVESRLASHAVRVAITATRRAMAEAGMPVEPIAVEAARWDDGPGQVSLAPLGIVGMAEIAEILGVSRQRAHELAKLADFPTPIGQPSAGDVYNKADIDAYAAARSRKPGRPRKAVS